MVTPKRCSNSPVDEPIRLQSSSNQNFFGSFRGRPIGYNGCRNLVHIFWGTVTCSRSLLLLNYRKVPSPPQKTSALGLPRHSRSVHKPPESLEAWHWSSINIPFFLHSQQMPLMRVWTSWRQGNEVELIFNRLPKCHSPKTEKSHQYKSHVIIIRFILILLSS